MGRGGAGAVTPYPRRQRHDWEGVAIDALSAPLVQPALDRLLVLRSSPAMYDRIAQLGKGFLSS
jgi:hypothetical protein